MANLCERCKRSMTSHDDQASCPLCRLAAGECSLDLGNPCNIYREWTSNNGGTQKIFGGCQRREPASEGDSTGLQSSFDLKRGYLSRPGLASSSGPTSEISSQA